MKQYIATHYRCQEEGELDIERLEFDFLECDTDEDAHGVRVSSLGDYDGEDESFYSIQDITRKIHEDGRVEETLQINEEDYRLALAISKEPLSKCERVGRIMSLFLRLSLMSRGAICL